MAKMGLGDAIIIAKIKTSKCMFSLADEDFLELSKAGVSDTVIAAMLGCIPVWAQEPEPEAEETPVQEQEVSTQEKEIESAEPKDARDKTAEEAPPIPEHDPIILKDIKKVYLEEMPNDLHTYIQAEMVKKFKGKIVPVLKVEDADAIMTGVGEHQKGVGAAVTGRYLGLHDTATGAINILCQYGDHLIWADEAGDRSLFFGVFMRGGPRKVASRLMKHLDKAVKQDRKRR